MKYLLVYMSNNGYFGNVDCDFFNEPPSIEDVRDAEKDISKRFCNGNQAVVTNWMKIKESEI